MQADHHKMELPSGWWGWHKMAVGSTRSGSANRDQPVCSTQRHRLMLWVGKLIHSSFKLWLYEKPAVQEISEWIWKHVPNIITSHVLGIKGKKKFEYLHDESASANHAWVWPTGLCCYNNAAHRLGKYHVPSTVEVHGERGSTIPAATGNQLSNNKTWHSIRTLAFLTGCHNVQICIVTWRGWTLFLERHPGNQTLIKYRQTQYRCLLTYKHTHKCSRKCAQTHRKVIYYPHSHKTPPSGENESVAFFLSWEQREKNDCMSCSFHKRKTCSKLT